MSDSKRAIVISVFAIIGIVLGLIICLAILNNGYYFDEAVTPLVLSIIIGLSLPSVPFVVAWLWRKIRKITNYFLSNFISIIVTALIIYFTCMFWIVACIIVTVWRFVSIKMGNSTEHWGKVIENRSLTDDELAALPTCPECGRPIKISYVNEYWKFRYFHATYAPNCKWEDNSLNNPYKPALTESMINVLDAVERMERIQ